MDSIFGIGSAELIFILLLAGLLMGPQQIRKMARLLGLWTARVQRYYRDFILQLNSELDAADLQEMKEAMREVKELRQQVQILQQDVNRFPNALAGNLPNTAVLPPTALRRQTKMDANPPQPENIIQPPRPLLVEDDPI